MVIRLYYLTINNENNNNNNKQEFDTTMVVWYYWCCCCYLLLLLNPSNGFFVANEAVVNTRVSQPPPESAAGALRLDCDHSLRPSRSSRIRINGPQSSSWHLASSYISIDERIKEVTHHQQHQQQEGLELELEGPMLPPAVVDRSYYFYQTNTITSTTTIEATESNQKQIPRLWEEFLLERPQTINKEQKQKNKKILEGDSISGFVSQIKSAIPSLTSKLSPSAKTNANNQPGVPTTDVTVIWDPSIENPEDVARNVIEKCLRTTSIFEDNNNVNVEVVPKEIVSSLTESLQAYSLFCRTHVQSLDANTKDDCLCCSDKNNNYDESQNTGAAADAAATTEMMSSHPSLSSSNLLKCRIVATRGPLGAKCPQYHMDHVPVRWIQTFVGQGVDIVEMERYGRTSKTLRHDDNDDNTDGISWNLFGKDGDDDDNDDNNDDGLFEMSPQERNQRLVDPNRSRVYKVPEGQAVLMVGTRWNEFAVATKHTATPADDDDQNKFILKPVIHKSPEIEPNCGRVLLTQDILI